MRGPFGVQQLNTSFPAMQQFIAAEAKAYKLSEEIIGIRKRDVFVSAASLIYSAAGCQYFWVVATFGTLQHYTPF